MKRDIGRRQVDVRSQDGVIPMTCHLKLRPPATRGATGERNKLQSLVACCLRHPPPVKTNTALRCIKRTHMQLMPSDQRRPTEARVNAPHLRQIAGGRASRAIRSSAISLNQLGRSLWGLLRFSRRSQSPRLVATSFEASRVRFPLHAVVRDTARHCGTGICWWHHHSRPFL